MPNQTLLWEAGAFHTVAIPHWLAAAAAAAAAWYSNESASAASEFADVFATAKQVAYRRQAMNRSPES